MNATGLSVAQQVQHLLADLPDIGTVADGELREELLNCEQATQMLMARQASAMAEMGRRAQHSDRLDEQHQGRRLWSSESRSAFVADEMAVTLVCTKGVAARRYAIAVGAAALPSIMNTWATGRIDERKVAVIADGVRDVDEVFADSLAATAAEYATKRTPTELRAWLARRVIAADPGAAEVRRARATADRRISLMPLPDGVSELTALLPSIQARQIYDTANAIAAGAGADDRRTMDQRRADALFDLLVGRADPPQVHVQVMVPVDTLLDAGAEPGVVPGIGPITSSEARDLAAGGCGSAITWRRLLTDAATGTLLDVAEKQYRPSLGLDRAVRARDVTCRFPGCRRSAIGSRTGTDLDHTVPWPEGTTQATNLAVLCRHHHRVKHSPGWNVEYRTDGILQWTTPVGRTFSTEPWAYTESVAHTAPSARGADPPPT